MRPLHETNLFLKRHAPALAVALVLHIAAAAAIHAGMQDVQQPNRTEARKVVAELITLPPRRIEQPQQVPPPIPKQAVAAPAKVQPKTAPRPVAPGVQAPAPTPSAAPAAEANTAKQPSAAQAAQQPATSPVQAAPVAAAAPAAVTAPRFDAAYLNNPKPAYPLAARKLGEEGTVLLHVRVSAEGLPARIEVRTSSGSDRLDDAARNAVAQWRFVPAKQGEEPVAAWVLVPLVFKMNG
ncbi:MAG TPA: energy transducer TonB [Noviherbaspirillum sp.]|nr:energy transducer TonB [Noviherbaspirillum sp.]